MVWDKNVREVKNFYKIISWSLFFGKDFFQTRRKNFPARIFHSRFFLIWKLQLLQQFITQLSGRHSLRGWSLLSQYNSQHTHWPSIVQDDVLFFPQAKVQEERKIWHIYTFLIIDNINKNCALAPSFSTALKIYFFSK